MAIYKCTCQYKKGNYPTTTVYIEAKNAAAASLQFLRHLVFSSGKAVTIEQVADWPEWMKRLEDARRG